VSYFCTPFTNKLFQCTTNFFHIKFCWSFLWILFARIFLHSQFTKHYYLSNSSYSSFSILLIYVKTVYIVLVFKNTVVLYHARDKVSICSGSKSPVFKFCTHLRK
jgi:hypothetical protein